MNIPRPPAPPNAPSGAKLIQAGQMQKQSASRLRLLANQVRIFADSLTTEHILVKTVRAIRTALIAIRVILEPIQTALSGLFDALNSIKVPKLEIKTAKVVGITVVTGISIENTKPLAGAAMFFATMATAVGNLRESLGTMRDSLGELLKHRAQFRLGLWNLANELRLTAESMDATGDALIQAGSSPPNAP